MLWQEAVEALDALDSAKVRHWVAGGWGVDVLVGKQTRPHRDLDLAVDVDQFELCMAVLTRIGYAVETDWLPIRVEFAASGERWVDIHPVKFDEQGVGIQGDPTGTHFLYPPGSLAEGRLGARCVPILSAEHQELFHSGYKHRPEDEHDLAQLTALRNRG